MKFENPFKKSAPKSEEASSPNSLNRREFLLYAGAVGLGVVGGEAVLKAEDEIRDIEKGKTLDDYQRDISEIFNETELTEKILTIQSSIKERYGIIVALETEDLESTSAYSATELRLTKQIEALEILQGELNKYPDFMIKQYGLETMAITSKSDDPKYNLGGYVMPGNIDSQRLGYRTELVLHYDWNAEQLVPENKRFYKGAYIEEGYDAGQARRDWHKLNFQGAIHHELAHLFIDTQGTETTPRHTENQLKDAWDKDFKSVNDDLRSYYSDTMPEITKDNPDKADYNRIIQEMGGVARGYGLTNEQEDRATIMEFMMIKGPIDIYKKHDNLLKEKTESLKKYYNDASCGLMNDRYWDDLFFKVSTEDIQNYFSKTAAMIIATPFEDSDYKDQVSKDKYEEWQNKLRHTTLANNDVGTK